MWIGTAGSHLFGGRRERGGLARVPQGRRRRRTCELAGVDIVSGTTMWRYPADGRWGDRVAITGTASPSISTPHRAARITAELIVIDTSSGKTRKAAGYNSLLSAGPNWLLTDGGPTPEARASPQRCASSSAERRFQRWRGSRREARHTLLRELLTALIERQSRSVTSACDSVGPGRPGRGWSTSPADEAS